MDAVRFWAPLASPSVVCNGGGVLIAPLMELAHPAAGRPIEPARGGVDYCQSAGGGPGPLTRAVGQSVGKAAVTRRPPGWIRADGRRLRNMGRQPRREMAPKQRRWRPEVLTPVGNRAALNSAYCSNEIRFVVEQSITETADSYHSTTQFILSAIISPRPACFSPSK